MYVERKLKVNQINLHSHDHECFFDPKRNIDPEINVFSDKCQI